VTIREASVEAPREMDAQFLSVYSMRKAVETARVRGSSEPVRGQLPNPRALEVLQVSRAVDDLAAGAGVIRDECRATRGRTLTSERERGCRHFRRFRRFRRFVRGVYIRQRAPPRVLSVTVETV
jgi:hypothetical protein